MKKYHQEHKEEIREQKRKYHQEHKDKIKCGYCGEEFYVIPSRKDIAKFCSRDCKNNFIKRNYKEKYSHCGFQKGHGLLRSPITEEENKIRGRKNSINMKNWYKNNPNSNCGYQKGHKVFHDKKGKTHIEEYGEKKATEISNKISETLKEYFKQNPNYPNFDRNIQCDLCGKECYYKGAISKFKRSNHYCSIECKRKGYNKVMTEKFISEGKRIIKPNKMPLCACGCGEKIEWKYWNQSGSQPLSKYKYGHYGGVWCRIKNPETSKKVSNTLKRYHKRYGKDIQFTITINLRTRFRTALKIYSKTGKILTSRQYGIDYKAIIEHLKPFPEHISKYHIDHIRPLCSFNFINEDGSTNLEEIKIAFAPENHQLLTAFENLSKGGRY